MALDKANNRLFIGHHGNSRYDIYPLGDDGLPEQRHADYGIGRSLIGRGFAFAPLGRTYLNFPFGGSVDEVNQRLFVTDNASLGPPGYRIMVFDVRPESLAELGRGELPEAIGVLGQPHFETWSPGEGPATIGGGGSGIVDSERQLYFFADSGNNRVLVWDIHPDRFENGMEARFVIGQPDLTTRQRGLGRDRFAGAGGLAYDDRLEHLYVSDNGNRRILVFDVSDANLRSGIEAMAVIGQNDFDTREANIDLRKYRSGVMAVDTAHHRLFVGEQFGNRILVFDVHPDKLSGALDEDAIAVLGQPDFQSTDPAVSQTRLTMPRITIDSERQLAYVPDGYPAGNRINIFDIHPDRMRTAATPMLDQLGHINPEGEADFLVRSANNRISPRYWTQARDVSLDTVDHRLFVSDNYGHRVLIYQLDRMNRILDRGARWALGQPDTQTSILRPGQDATSIKLPLAVEYDDSHKRLFVADTWSDRVLVFDMTPGQVESGMEASYVLGQADFTSYDPRAAQNRIYFGSRAGRGIYPSEARAAEMAMDRVNQRLFVTDGGNHRVLVFDVHPERIANGADALAVLGQDDFTSTETGLSRTRWELPGDLELDEANQRLFVGVAWQHRVLAFDVHPDRLRNGQEASFVVGQVDFTSGTPGLSRNRFRQTDGLSYDRVNDRLYVTDKYNHRVLAYDLPPGQTANLPDATAVIGEQTFDSVEMGPGDPRHHPDRLHDPRGSDFDSRDQRLFQSEGLNGRMTVFTLPRIDYRVDLPARSQLAYESLDAQMSTGSEAYAISYSELELESAGELVALSGHLLTRATMDADSERQSRVLESEVVLDVPDPARSALFYMDTRGGRTMDLSIVNGNDAAVEVQLQLRTTAGRTATESRRLSAGEQWALDAGDLFGADVLAALAVEADAPVSASGVLRIPDGRGGTLLAEAPRARDAIAGLPAQRRVLPSVTTGAGRQVAYVLLNNTDEAMVGVLETDGTSVDYEIAPGGLFLYETGQDTRPHATGFGIVRALQGAAPSAAALVLDERRDASIRSAHVVTSHQEGTLMWAPVNTYPSLLRHGDIDFELSLVNEGRVPATVYLELFDLDGNSTAKHERIVPLGRRVQLSLEDVFRQSPLRGTVRVFSDAAVAALLQRSTANVLGELVVTNIPLQPARDAADSLIYPRFANGDGSATELLVINTGRDALQGELRIRSSDGNAQTVVLR